MCRNLFRFESGCSTTVLDVVVGHLHQTATVIAVVVRILSKDRLYVRMTEVGAGVKGGEMRQEMDSV